MTESQQGFHVPEGSPGPPPRSAGPPMNLWVLIPVIAGTALGVAVAVLPWGRYLLVFTLVVSGLAWVLRIASDWLVEQAGPQRGMAMLAVILFGTWLVLAVASPAPLRELGFGPIKVGSEPPDPYALPPAGSRRPLNSLKEPSEPIDPVEPLKELIRPDPEYTEPDAPVPPADGRQGTPSLSLRLSSSQSTAGDGLVLIAEIRGDGRPVRGYIEFMVGDRVVERRLLRVQGLASQTEARITGLAPGTYDIRARYQGSRSFSPAESERLPHRVVPRR